MGGILTVTVTVCCIHKIPMFMTLAFPQKREGRTGVQQWTHTYMFADIDCHEALRKFSKYAVVCGVACGVGCRVNF